MKSGNEYSLTWFSQNVMVLLGEVKNSSFEGQCFQVFISKKLKTRFMGNKDDMVIVYNCKFHQKTVIDLFNDNNILFKFLHSYSTHLTA